MKLLDHHEASSVSSEWIDLVEKLGVDRVYAHDVVGAVYTFCRVRHGAAVLGDDYVSFLVARSACGAKGDILTADHIERIGSRHSEKERMMLRALASSSDPSSLYDTFRMKLVTLQTSQVFPGGYVISAGLKKVSAGPHENISFLWLALFKRVAASLADWRKGNPGLHEVVVKTGCEKNDYPAEQRDLFITTLRQIEQKRGISPSRLIWTK